MLKGLSAGIFCYFQVKIYYLIKSKILEKYIESENFKVREELQNKLKNTKNKLESEIDKETFNLIINSSIDEIHNLYKKGKVSVTQVVKAFCLQTCTVSLTHNLITDFDFDNSLNLAKIFDETIKTDSKNWPELLGIPISIKDHIQVNGMRSCCGLSKLRNNISDKDSYLTSLLKRKGAIIIAKGNVPQALFCVCSENNIFGPCKNPWNKEKSCGGSSGGDGGLVAAKSVPLAIGTDLAGSIRVPAV